MRWHRRGHGQSLRTASAVFASSANWSHQIKAPYPLEERPYGPLAHGTHVIWLSGDHTTSRISPQALSLSSHNSRRLSVLLILSSANTPPIWFQPPTSPRQEQGPRRHFRFQPGGEEACHSWARDGWALLAALRALRVKARSRCRQVTLTRPWNNPRYSAIAEAGLSI